MNLQERLEYAYECLQNACKGEVDCKAPAYWSGYIMAVKDIMKYEEAVKDIMKDEESK